MLCGYFGLDLRFRAQKKPLLIWNGLIRILGRMGNRIWLEGIGEGIARFFLSYTPTDFILRWTDVGWGFLLFVIFFYFLFFLMVI